MVSRRRVLAWAGMTTVGASALSIPLRGQPDSVPTDQYPTQPPELILEMVTASHFDLSRVRQLVEARPALARAAWDWGFGDWEDALGAASHTGARPVAEYLLSKGARPTIMSAAMLGQLEVVKAFVTASPGIQRIVGPHSIRLLAHARAGGAAARPVVEYLEALGDADLQPKLVPLSEADEARLSGAFAFGTGTNDYLEILPTPRSRTAPPRIPGGELSVRRPGRTIRQLFHLEGFTFYPSGAEAVRIRITVTGGRAAGLTVHDPDVVLTATRRA